MRPVRLGAVGYLNARPLVAGLTETLNSELRTSSSRSVIVRFDPPSVCADLLASGDIDLGLIPSISYLDRAGDRIVPGISIGSDGPVASVALFTRRPVRQIRTLALDTSSRTSAVLVRILCARRFEIAPTFQPFAPDLSAMLASCDAALLIGDPALFADYAGVGAEKVDLGQAWADMTGLPFVWAFWAGRPDAADRDVVRVLQSSRDAGVASTDAIADAYCAGDPSRQALARRYLRDNIQYGLTDRMLDGLLTYYDEAAALGLVSRTGPVEFFESDAAV